MELSATLDSDHPAWQDYSAFLNRVTGAGIPTCDQLNQLLPDGLVSKAGYPIRFVNSDELSEEPYERRIFNSGRVSTRPDNFHDFFNALVWARFPRTKSAMNSCHYKAWHQQQAGARGPVRDALTLFDECGVVVFSSNLQILQSLAARRWPDAFLHPGFYPSVSLSVFGHAILEKYLQPYKSMTAKTLLVEVDPNFMTQPREAKLQRLDEFISAGLATQELLQSPSCLSPLPLAGVPGWWPQDEQQDAAFYQDKQVFRPPSPDLRPAPIFRL